MMKRTFTSLLAAAGAAWALRALRRQSSYSFAGRSVVITGSSRGLGLVLARVFAQEGAQLTILARDNRDLELAQQDLQARGADVLAIQCDVRDQGDVEDAIRHVIAHYGRIDVLVNNAGVIQSAPIEHMVVDDFQNALGTHLWGALYMMLAALPHMRQQGGGRIVNIASIGGKIAVPHLLPYSTSKFALVGLSDGMRAEVAKDGIKVTTVSPGLMRTGSHLNAQFKGQHAAEFTWFALADALPISSLDAQRAAQQIVEACRRGDPQLVVSIQAQIAVLANTVVPDVVARLMQLANRLLPQATTQEGDELKDGWASQSSLAPSVLTRLADQATVDNNGLRGHAPPASVATDGRAANTRT